MCYIQESCMAHSVLVVHCTQWARCTANRNSRLTSKFYFTALVRAVMVGAGHGHRTGPWPYNLALAWGRDIQGSETV